MPQYNYIAIARNGAGLIAKGDRITFQSERQVEESSGLSFRHEIAEAVRQQLHADIDPAQEAQTATNFDVYSEARYAEVREKLEAAAAREAAAEERRRKAEERQQAREQREADKASKDSGNRTDKEPSNRVGQNGTAIRPKKKSTGKKSAASGVMKWLAGIKLKSLLKFLVAAVAVVWFLATQMKSCSLQSVLEELGVKTEQTTTKKKSSSTKKSTSSSKKKSTSTKKSSSSTSSSKKSTSSKKSSSTKKSTTKKSSSKSK